MPDHPKQCPECGERYQWYEAECTECHVALVDDPSAPSGIPDVGIASVFQTDDPGLLPLAKMALETEGIEYQVANEPSVGIGPQAASYRQAKGASEIFVAEDVADRARQILADLEAGGAVTPAAPVPAPAAPADRDGDLTVRLEDQDTHQHIGDITDGQLDFLLTNLEQESPADWDFYVDAATIDLLAERGGDATLIEMLRHALGVREGMDVACIAIE
jgi:hypothetical protein